MKFQLFVDMDGVIADFDKGYELLTGKSPKKTDDNIDWKLIDSVGGFYRDLPLMPDFNILWNFIKYFDPILLSGIPKEVPSAAADKRSWVTKYIGPSQPLITCLSKDKSLHIKSPGDILIDDWEKYMHIWTGKGGRWITHTDAQSTIKKLVNLISRH